MIFFLHFLAKRNFRPDTMLTSECCVQAGGELTDFIIVLRTNAAVKTFSSDTHLSIGAGLSAAFGIIGRTAEADLRAGANSYSACYTYSCSKGYFSS